jgi:biopolymer transport protein ExbB/TolQ
VGFFRFLSDYLANGSAVTIIVVSVLSIYFVYTVWLFVYRYRVLSQRIDVESRSLTKLYMGLSSGVSKNSMLFSYIQKVDTPVAEMMNAAINDSVRSATKGLTQLSIMASTSPFVGLFGTVVGILEAFSRLGLQKSASLSVVAPAISEALVATAVGIFVAIFAYTFHLILKRMAYELQSLMQSESEIVLAQSARE